MNKEQFIAFQESGHFTIPALLIEKYANLGLNEAEFIMILKVQYYIQRGIFFPTPEQLSEQMSISTTSCTSMLRSLMQRGFLHIEEFQQDTIMYEKYSLKPLWERLYDSLQHEQAAEHKLLEKELENSLYTVFEQEFGRPLSPFECETFSIWLDQDYHDPIIIKAALREAVISGKLNFRYIDRILFEWKKNGIKTIEQARNHGKKFRQHQQKDRSAENDSHKDYVRKVPFYNWLES
ncbi:DnaD domain protein [Bacillus lacus]|uniref:DnaD domain protein n=1 Tax=Metabacillus lacus TaxID=1983721 RepID=A0A7X2IWX1_9BACI|nr:DnaD domain-containing protein [Metabacillus lacus]MRX70962.1 DnaD domain protein [Metabacillus lacus]